MTTYLLDDYDQGAPGAGVRGRAVLELPYGSLHENLQKQITPPTPEGVVGLVPSSDGEGRYELSQPAGDRSQATLDALFPPKELGRWHKDIAAGEANVHYKTDIALPPNGELEFEVQGSRALHIVAGDNTVMRVPITKTNIGLDVGEAVTVSQFGSDLRNIVYVNGKLVATRVSNNTVRMYELTLEPPQTNFLGSVQGISSIKCMTALSDNTIYAIDDSDRLFKFHLGTFRATLVRQLSGGWFSTVVPETLCSIGDNMFVVCAYSGVINTFDISGRPVVGIIDHTRGTIKQHGIPWSDTLVYYTGVNGYKEMAGMTTHKVGATGDWGLFAARKGGDGEVLHVRIDDPSDPTATEPGSTGGDLGIANRALKGLFDSPTEPGILLVGHDSFLAHAEPGAGDAKAAGNFVLDATDQYFFGHKDGIITAGAVDEGASFNPLVIRNRPIQQGRRIPILAHGDHNLGLGQVVANLPVVRQLTHAWEYTDKLIFTFGVFYGGPSGFINTWKHFAKQREVSLHHYNGVGVFHVTFEGSSSLAARSDRTDAYQGLQYYDMNWDLRVTFEAANKKQLKFIPRTSEGQAGTDVGIQLYSIEIER